MVKFQFPSNGKVYLDVGSNGQNDGTNYVSIPFKREGVSGHEIIDSLNDPELVSIPFKREGVSGLVIGAVVRYRKGKFQFPSNGKVYLDSTGFWANAPIVTSFNSLQTGRCIWTGDTDLTVTVRYECFNSLQTGRCIWTGTRSGVTGQRGISFNSLQTGRCIWTGQRRIL